MEALDQLQREVLLLPQTITLDSSPSFHPRLPPNTLNRSSAPLLLNPSLS
jgi:hypothetical protein